MRKINPRSRGAFDPVDLCVGIGLAIALPLVAWVLLRMTGIIQTKTDLTLFRETLNVQVPADLEEVTMRLAFIARTYNENAHEFVRRFQTTRGNQQVNERKWAMNSLSKVRADLTKIESLIGGEPEALNQFATQLREIARLKQSIEEDQRILADY